MLLVGRIDGNRDRPLCEGLEQRFLFRVSEPLITPNALTKPPFEESPNPEANRRIWKRPGFRQACDES